MRDKLKTYIDYLFAGAPQTAATAETKAEILQNTLDKYDDLIAEGKHRGRLFPGRVRHR